MPWNEVRDSTQSVSRDMRGKLRGTRKFRVWGYSRTQILVDPTSILNDAGEPLPAYGSSWENMRLDQYSTEPNGEVFDVYAHYSSDATFTFPSPIEPYESPFLSFSGALEVRVIDIPYAVNSPKKLGDGFGAVTVDDWDLSPVLPVAHTFERVVVRVAKQNLGATERAVIRDQYDKIHFLGPPVVEPQGWYLFTGATYSEIEPTKWAIEYEWVKDPGTNIADMRLPPDMVGQVVIPVPQWDDEGNPVSPPPPGSTDPDIYIRPPFFDLVLLPGINTSTGKPDPSAPPTHVIHIGKDRTQPDAWQGLPGIS